MVKNKVGLYLGGHLHLTHKVYQYADTTHEFVSESFHGRTGLFEDTLPVWYVFTYDEVGNSITIERYAVEWMVLSASQPYRHCPSPDLLSLQE